MSQNLKRARMGIGYQIAVGLLSVGVYVFCDYTITRWAEQIQPDGLWTWRLFCVVLLAPVGIIAFGLVGATMGLAAVSGFINTGIVVGGVVIGVFLRGDQLTVYQKVGLVLGFLAMLLLNSGNPSREGS